MSVGAVNKSTGDRIPTAGMPAIDDALDLTSVNPVQNAVITAALANKQDKTDNSLQTTDKTVVGAINEHEGDIDSLKSGLTNVENKLKGSIWTYVSTDNNDYIAIEASPGARYIVLLNTMGSNGINGFDTVIFSINAGYNPSNFNTMDIRTANDFVKEVSYDNYRYIIKEKKVSEDAYGEYLKALVIKTFG